MPRRDWRPKIRVGSAGSSKTSLLSLFCPSQLLTRHGVRDSERTIGPAKQCCNDLQDLKLFWV